MIFNFIVTFLCQFLVVSAYQILVTPEPIVIDPCHDVTCPPIYTECHKTYVPSGSCCPICACMDEKNNVYEVGQSFLLHKNNKCYGCTCKSVDGAKSATCYEMYCPYLSCPVEHQVQLKNSCCKECPYVAPRTFPPLPSFGLLRDNESKDKAEEKNRWKQAFE
ncbi:kielin/chordin-like protein isoform X2 [Rhopilema esculentum]|uniref:kielin/chordin-like protein isoform X2 n=1 Tax=Rhopilema esculentum TaxID=499914 RepID=UPI0031D5B358